MWWPLTLACAGQLLFVDPLDLLDAQDPWLRSWAESVASDPSLDLTDELIERSARGSFGPDRREALSVQVRGMLAVQGRPGRIRSEAAVWLTVRFAFDALWLPRAVVQALPREERERRRRCQALVDGHRVGRGRSPPGAERRPRARFLALESRSARWEALGCGSRRPW